MAVKPGHTKQSWHRLLIAETLIPVLLVVLTPIFLLSYVHFAVESRSRLASTNTQGITTYLQKVIADANYTDKQCWAVVLVFAAWCAFAPLCIGGRKFYGPLTTGGFRPQYIDSGFRFFILSTAVIGGFLLVRPIGWTLYVKLFPLTCTTTAFGFIVSVLLYIKGVIFPSAGEHGSTGNVLFDFYWGRELYPRIGKYWDLKMWAVAFYGMMGWFAVVLICWKAQYEQIGFNWAMSTSCLTLTMYMLKFYWWYVGYANCIDIMYDRLGFYLGWGGIGLMPTFMACNAVYMVENPSDLGPVPCLTLTALGVLFTFLTYRADMQRLWVRQADGKCKVWGRPAQVIRATYKDDKGITRKSLLLTSGFWGVVRHPNYLIEFTTNLLWMFPAKLDSFVPYLWGFFLLGIFLQRIGRDDERCRRKYGKFWEEYCAKVPYVLIPGIF